MSLREWLGHHLCRDYAEWQELRYTTLLARNTELAAEVQAAKEDLERERRLSTKLHAQYDGAGMARREAHAALQEERARYARLHEKWICTDAERNAEHHALQAVRENEATLRYRLRVADARIQELEGPPTPSAVVLFPRRNGHPRITTPLPVGTVPPQEEHV